MTTLTWCLIALATEVPPEVSVADALRFPGKELCVESLCFNRECQDNFRVRLSVCLDNERPAIERMLSCMEKLEAAWQKLYWAHYYAANETCVDYVCDRLRQLRDLIGSANYRAGVMPDPVPLAYFQPIY